MAKTTKSSKKNPLEEDVESVPELSEVEDDLNDEAVIELTDIPIDQFLKDPKMSEITEESEVEEVTAWCPVCNDYTIFADNTCTVCGFRKGSRKLLDDEESEESIGNDLELTSLDESIEELDGYSSFDDDEYREDY